MNWSWKYLISKHIATYLQKNNFFYNGRNYFFILYMNLSDFDYDLPQELIAQTPIEPRDHSRILKLDKDSWNIEESKFYEILDELSENDVLVLNKTSVINARLHGYITKNISNSSPLIGGRLGGGFCSSKKSSNRFLHWLKSLVQAIALR